MTFSEQFTRCKNGLLAACALLALAGCATYTPNQRLDRIGSDTGYRFENISARHGINEDFIVVSLSGGGTRAAALAYGVLKHLDGVAVGDGGGSLLDEVNVISSVSGGSFVAAYYGLYGKRRFFREFPEKMLYRPMQRELILETLSPWNWPGLWSGRYGRSELAEEYYARHLFGDHTFGDLPLRWPYIIINATDVTLGGRFSFDQVYFDMLCADLSTFPIARAVTASSAFPGGFSALTLNNYPNECGYERPHWVSRTLAVGPDKRPILHGIARNWATYEDDAARPYIHLIDGGVADNLGTRSPVAAVVADIWRTPDGRPLAERIRRFIVIIVNAVADPRPDYDRDPGAPGLFDTLLKAGTSPLDNYTSDTVALIKLKFDELDKLNRNFAVLSEVCAELAAARCGRRQSCRETELQRCTDRFYTGTPNPPPYPELYLVHVRFNLAKDPALRARLRAVPTSLQLPREQVDLVVNSAATLLKESAEFQRLLGDLSAAEP